MATISRTGIANASTINASHITNIIDALDGTSASTTVIATGSFSGSFRGIFTGSVAGTASWATTAQSASITNTTTGTGPYYITFVDAVTGTRVLRADSAANALAFNATTNTLTTTASYALTASYVENAGSGDGTQYMTLRLASGVITSLNSGSVVYIGTGVSSSSVDRSGVFMPFGGRIASASFYVNNVSNLSSAGLLVTMSVWSNTTETPILVVTGSSLDPRNNYIDGHSISAGGVSIGQGRGINVSFTPTDNMTGAFIVSADLLVYKYP